MLSNITVVCVQSNHRDFEMGNFYRISEWGYVRDWVICDNLRIYNKWNDINSGVVAEFDTVNK